jgi:hypothetical protein
MATYTAAQLYGTGSIGENLSGIKTFTFTNPSGSAYFTLETVREPNGFYTGSTPTNTLDSPIEAGFIPISFSGNNAIQTNPTLSIGTTDVFFGYNLNYEPWADGQYVTFSDQNSSVVYGGRLFLQFAGGFGFAFKLYEVLTVTGTSANATSVDWTMAAAAVWNVSSSMGFVSSPYIASVVVQPGISTLTFTPASAVTGSTYYLRGTGNYSLTIS